MGAKKVPNYTPMTPTPQAKKPTSTPDTSIQKAEIDRMKKLLSEKIKNPELARKAAMIISEMLDKK